MPHGLIYNATWESSTKTLAFYDRSGNIVYSCVVDVSPQPIVDDPTKPLYIRCMSPDGGTIYLTGTAITTDSFERSTDGVTWEPWQVGSVGTISLGHGQGIYIRAASARTEFPSSNMITIHMNGGADVRFEAYHNVNSMLSPNFTSITDLTTLASNGVGCFKRLFYQQRQLSKAPLLPATTLSKSCYYEMFRECQSLQETPEFPWTTTAEASCYYMFRECSSLSVAHDLHASIVEGSSTPSSLSGAYYSMFSYCTSLVSPPALNATECKARGCSYMFNGCSSLTTAPVLPTAVTGGNAFERMFQGCTSLTKSPLIAVDTLTQSCCNYMFSGCTSLHEIHINSTDISASSCLSNWVSNVAPTGDFYCAKGVSFPVDSASGIPQGWTIHRSTVESPNLPLCFKATLDDCSVTLKKNGTVTESYEYSMDGITWNAWSFDLTIPLDTGDTVYVRTAADRATAQTSSNYIWFHMSTVNGYDSGIEAYNNVNSLLQKTTFPTLTDLTTAHGDYAFYRLFKGPGDAGRNFINHALLKAPLLPATTLGTACYRNMFLDCRNLTTAPELPATTLVASCYSYMFGHCDSLSSVHIYATDISATDCLKYWIYNNPATGNFYCVNGVNYPSGESGIPTGWTRIDL